MGTKEWINSGATDRYDIAGGIAGVTVGAIAQTGALVFGVEGEWLWAPLKGSGRFNTLEFGGTVFEITDRSSRADWLALASARLGFAADRWPPHVRGGVAFAEEGHRLQRTLLPFVPGFGIPGTPLSGHRLHTGYLVGAGVEYALAGNWSAKFEYNYIDFRRHGFVATGVAQIVIPGLGGGTNDITELFAIRQTLHLVKIGVNYHFSPQPDVVAVKY